MSPELGKLWFRVAVFFILVSAVMLAYQKPGTAGLVLTVTTLVIGIIFAVIIAIIVRRP